MIVYHAVILVIIQLLPTKTFFVSIYIKYGYSYIKRFISFISGVYEVCLMPTNDIYVYVPVLYDEF